MAYISIRPMTPPLLGGGFSTKSKNQGSPSSPRSPRAERYASPRANEKYLSRKTSLEQHGNPRGVAQETYSHQGTPRAAAEQCTQYSIQATPRPGIALPEHHKSPKSEQGARAAAEQGTQYSVQPTPRVERYSLQNTPRVEQYSLQWTPRNQHSILLQEQQRLAQVEQYSLQATPRNHPAVYVPTEGTQPSAPPLPPLASTASPHPISHQGATAAGGVPVGSAPSMASPWSLPNLSPGPTGIRLAPVAPHGWGRGTPMTGSYSWNGSNNASSTSPLL
jgi:hypothetical protein